MRFALLTVAGLVLLGLGFLIGSTMSQPTSKTTISSQRVVIDFAAPAAQSDSSPIEFQQLLSQPTTFHSIALAYQLIADKDPVAVQSFVLDVVGLGPQQISLRHGLTLAGLRRLASIDPQATVEFVEANHSIRNGTYLGIVINNWGFSDPQGLVDYVKEMQPGDRQTRFAQHLVGNQLLANANLAYELDYLVPNQAEEIRNRKAIQILSPRDAFQHAFQLTDNTRSRRMRDAVVRWSEVEPYAAFQAVSELSDDEAKMNLLDTVYRKLVSVDLDLAISYLEASLDEPEIVTTIIGSLAEQHPELALSYAQSSSNENLERIVVNRWARSDPRRAIAYIDSMDLDETNRMNMYYSAYSQYFHNDSLAALETLSEKVDGNEMMMNLIHHIQINDNNEVQIMRFLEGSNQPIIQSNLLQALTRYKAQSNPAAAFEWLDNHRATPGYASAMAETVAYIAKDSPDAALAKLEPIMDHEDAIHALGSIASSWYWKDADAAMGWVQQLEEGRARDTAMAALIPNIMANDFDQALELVKDISTPYLRDDTALMMANQLVYVQRDLTEDQIIEMLGVTGNTAERIRDMKRQLERARQRLRF